MIESCKCIRWRCYGYGHGIFCDTSCRSRYLNNIGGSDRWCCDRVLKIRIVKRGCRAPDPAYSSNNAQLGSTVIANGCIGESIHFKHGDGYTVNRFTPIAVHHKDCVCRCFSWSCDRIGNIGIIQSGNRCPRIADPTGCKELCIGVRAY